MNRQVPLPADYIWPGPIGYMPPAARVSGFGVVRFFQRPSRGLERGISM
jgi:hypothetical protein